jgi:hypothetical protein
LTPFLEGVLDGVGVGWPPCEKLAGGGYGEKGVDARNEEPETFESSVKDALLFGWR